MTWIRVEDRLPEPGKIVLVGGEMIAGMGPCTAIARLSVNGLWGNAVTGEWNLWELKITHWQPLPEAPSLEPKCDMCAVLGWNGENCAIPVKESRPEPKHQYAEC